MIGLGRLRTGVTHAQLDEHLKAEAAQWNEQHHRGSSFGKELYAVPLAEHLAGRLRLVVVVLMGAVFFVLLIACANVGSLQLVRAAGRMRELAVRAALGAGRARVARQLLVESAVLAVLGGAVGLWLGSVTLGLIARWGPTQQSLEGVHLDGRAIAFTALVATAAAIAFGTLPALRAFRVDLQSVTREVSRGVAGSAGASSCRSASHSCC
jgi:predicted lysophospholipase L1 biosynthesis ABC-type transport system permease subunit